MLQNFVFYIHQKTHQINQVAWYIINSFIKPPVNITEPFVWESGRLFHTNNCFMTQKIFLEKKARNYCCPRGKGLENVPWSDFQMLSLALGGQVCPVNCVNTYRMRMDAVKIWVHSTNFINVYLPPSAGNLSHVLNNLLTNRRIANVCLLKDWKLLQDLTFAGKGLKRRAGPLS